MPAEPELHRGYDIGRQFSIVLCFAGGLLLLGYATGQFGEDFTGDWALFAGLVCVPVGLVLTLLFAILIRQHRIEQRIEGLTDSREPKNDE